MRTSFIITAFITLSLCLLSVTNASAHPGSGIAVNKQGEVFFTDTGHGVWKIDKQGKLISMRASLFHWMALDEMGSFAESPKNFGEWFERVSPQNFRPAVITCSDFPLTVNHDGNIYYADTRSGSSRIMRKPPNGKETVLASGETFHGITGIASGPDGSLYITDAGGADANVIRKISLNGTVSMFAKDFVRRESAVIPPPETNALHCRGLDVDSQGVVYIAATGSRKVIRITPEGEVTTILQALSPWSPTGVAVFRGEVYVLEWHDAPASKTAERRAWIPRVRKIGRDGTVTTLATVSR